MRNDISLAVSMDYGFGEYFNNRAATLRLNYNLSEHFRVAPSFSKFLNKENMRMSSVSFDFHYLFSDDNFNAFPKLKNQGIYYYPVFGFHIISASGIRGRCTSCSIEQIRYGENSSYNFGFDFGVGVEYELPTLYNVFRNMSVNTELLYLTVENYYRPLVRFGLLYYF
jgi:hypothetical protein